MAPEYSDTARRILSYLAERGQATDTIEGIATWWLHSQQIDESLRDVQAALEELKLGGLVVESESWGTRALYQINQEKLGEVQAILSRRPPSDG